MKIFLAADHAGFELKKQLVPFLQEKGYDVEDCGAYALHPDDDYPDFVSVAAKHVSENPEDRAILCAGTGQAEMILANKFPGVRCALFYGPIVAQEAVDVSGRKSTDPYEIVRLTREHNNANMLSLGARFVSFDEAKKAIEIWLEEPFSNDARHVRRLGKMTKIEKSLSS